MTDKMGHYAKTYAALSAAILLTVQLVFGGIDEKEAALLTTAWLGVFSVWFFPNT